MHSQASAAHFTACLLVLSGVEGVTEVISLFFLVHPSEVNFFSLYFLSAAHLLCGEH